MLSLPIIFIFPFTYDVTYVGMTRTMKISRRCCDNQMTHEIEAQFYKYNDKLITKG